MINAIALLKPLVAILRVIHGHVLLVPSIFLILVLGCFTEPTPPPNWTSLCLEQIPKLGDAMLSSGVCRDAEDVIYLKVGRVDMVDKSRLDIDSDVLMKEMRTYLHAKSGGRILAFSDYAAMHNYCRKIQKQRIDAELRGWISYMAESIVRARFSKRAKTTIAVIPFKDSNAKKLNVDSLSALICDEIMKRRGACDIGILPPEKAFVADVLVECTLFSPDHSEVSTETDADVKLRIDLKDAKSGELLFTASMDVRKKLLEPEATYVLNGELNLITTSRTRLNVVDSLRLGFNLVDVSVPEEPLNVWEGSANINITTVESPLYK